LARLHVEAGRQVLGDELDVVPAEPGAVDLGAADVLERALAVARVHAGGLPVDHVLTGGRLAGRPAQGRGVGAGDDLHPFTVEAAVRLAGRRGRINRVAPHEGELLAHGPAALVDHVAHDL